MGERLDKDKIWMASLDGELSASESTAFESGLGERETLRLRAEMKLETALGNALQRGGQCPVETWNRVLARIEGRSATRAPHWAAPRTLTFLLVASMALMAGSYWWNAEYLTHTPPQNRGQAYQFGPGSPIMAIGDSDVSAFAAHAETGATLEEARAFLASHKIQLQLTDFSEANPGSRHRVKLLGACKGVCPSGSLVELMYSCCNTPAKLVIAPRNCSGESLLRKALARGEVQYMTEVGAFLVGVVSHHDAHELVNMLKPVLPSLV
ncbi:MAG: hypothetical protein HYV27_08215 [Candidatus Hydrogenedentes bacterium]|nr:hypothetical protein [Candidatus Hydrogenedentota bacterium]